MESDNIAPDLNELTMDFEDEKALEMIKTLIKKTSIDGLDYVIRKITDVYNLISVIGPKTVEMVSTLKRFEHIIELLNNELESRRGVIV